MSAPPSLDGKNALVTGASGFIGSRLCDRLLEHRVEVHGVSRSQQTSTSLRWSSADVCDTDEMLALIRDAKPDFIFHLASHVSGSRALDAVLPTFQTNLLSSVNVLLAAAEVGCSRVVLAGSLEEPDTEDPHPVPVSPYAAAKSAASAYGRMFKSLYEVPVVMLRIFMVYGPRQKDETKLVPYVITSLLRGEAPALSSGNRPVDWIYVDDVVDALIASVTADGVVGETVDAGSGVLTPIRTVVEGIVDLIRPSVEPHFGALPDRPNERIRVADVERTRALLNWTPRTPLEEGLSATVDWYATQKDAA
jgi:nucleoside-diphosphate-sugar epimerase